VQVGIEQATGIVYNITGGNDLTLHEVRGSVREGRLVAPDAILRT